MAQRVASLGKTPNLSIGSGCNRYRSPEPLLGTWERFYNFWGSEPKCCEEKGSYREPAGAVVCVRKDESCQAATASGLPQRSASALVVIADDVTQLEINGIEEATIAQMLRR